MNIFVCIKQVPDTETKIKPNDKGSYIDTTGIKWITNPYDEFAIEQALLLKAANTGSVVTAIRVGGVKDTEALRTAMAMGADEAILVEAPDDLDSYSTAKALKGAMEKSGKKPDIVFCGKQAIDDDCLQVPQLLAQMLDIPSVSVIVGFEQKGEDIVVKREIEGGSLEIYELKTPCLVATNKGLNTPRYASLPGIMRAKKKPLQQMGLEEVGVSPSESKVKYSQFRLPPEKPPGKKFDAMDEAQRADVVGQVAQLLRKEAKVI
ncbi:MAG: electron transfer flavoprotein subunit beta/FixA family protein [Bacteriovoracales bacterium]|nr:electron transfer flavoprotein subunit beta/FixA family protein [Bacteriovoracales bacterium]